MNYWNIILSSVVHRTITKIYLIIYMTKAKFKVFHSPFDSFYWDLFKLIVRTRLLCYLLSTFPIDIKSKYNWLRAVSHLLNMNLSVKDSRRYLSADISTTSTQQLTLRGSETDWLINYPLIITVDGSSQSAFFNLKW